MHAVPRPKDARLSVTLAYDAIAAGYDEQVRGDDWMRRVLHARYRRTFQPGERVLDVGCGTGIDALALAEMSVRVLGVDGSAEMIARLRQKVAAAGLEATIEARVLRIEDLADLADLDVRPKSPDVPPNSGRTSFKNWRFDGLISSFASLSSLPDLANFAADAARLVRPGGRLVLHLLNRFSAWEWLGYVARRDFLKAWRLGGQRQRLFVIGGQSVAHMLYFAHEAYARFFARDFGLRAAFGLGALRPPHTVRRFSPRVVDALEWLDVRLGGLPLVRSAGRFFVLDLERRAV